MERATIVSAPYFHDEEATYAFVEVHVWPKGWVCPHCGTVDNSGKLAGKSTRLGVYKCYDCRKPFTVKVGTTFESSHVKLHLWLQAIPSDIEREGHQQQSAAPNLGRHPQDRLIHGAPHPRVHRVATKPKIRSPARPAKKRKRKASASGS